MSDYDAAIKKLNKEYENCLNLIQNDLHYWYNKFIEHKRSDNKNKIEIRLDNNDLERYVSCNLNFFSISRILSTNIDIEKAQMTYIHDFTINLKSIWSECAENSKNNICTHICVVSYTHHNNKNHFDEFQKGFNNFTYFTNTDDSFKFKIMKMRNNTYSFIIFFLDELNKETNTFYFSEHNDVKFIDFVQFTNMNNSIGNLNHAFDENNTKILTTQIQTNTVSNHDFITLAKKVEDHSEFIIHATNEIGCLREDVDNHVMTTTHKDMHNEDIIKARKKRDYCCLC